MKELTLPKIHLTKKTILIASASFLVLAALITGLVILINHNKDGETSHQANTQENTKDGYANDADETSQYNTYQKIYSTQTDPKILVYGETADDPWEKDPNVLTLTEKCEYEDKEREENTYTLGSTPIEVKNHCILHIGYVVDSSKAVDALTAYLVLPDNSVIALDSNESPDIQVNIFEHEIRVIQSTGFAYYRIAPKKNGDIFTVELPTFSRIFTATGTELYAETGITLKSYPQYGLTDDKTYASGFFLYDGSGTIRAKGSSEILETMSSKDNSSVYFGYLSLTTFKTEVLPLVTDALDTLGRGDFLTNQKALSEKYGFGNFSSFTTDSLKAFVYDHTEDVYAKTVTNVEKMYAEENEKWENTKNNNTTSGGSSSTGGTSASTEECYAKGSAAYQLFCQMSSQGTIKNGECCMSY